MDAVNSESIDLARQVVRREPLDDLTEALSGARLERVALADGRTLILKQLPASGDWLTRATGGSGRLRKLWASGLLARVRPFVEHTIIDVQHVDDSDVVVMLDATEALLPGGGCRYLGTRLVRCWRGLPPSTTHSSTSRERSFALSEPDTRCLRQRSTRVILGQDGIHSRRGLPVDGSCLPSTSTATSSTRCSR